MKELVFCIRSNCQCGNKEIPNPEIYVLLGKNIPVPYCEQALEAMEAENAAYKPMNPSRKKKP